MHHIRHETMSNQYIGPAQCYFTDLAILKAKFSVIFGTVSFPIDDNHTVCDWLHDATGLGFERGQCCCEFDQIYIWTYF